MRSVSSAPVCGSKLSPGILGHRDKNRNRTIRDHLNLTDTHTNSQHAIITTDFHSFHRPPKKEKRSKKERKAATTIDILFHRVPDSITIRGYRGGAFIFSLSPQRGRGKPSGPGEEFQISTPLSGGDRKLAEHSGVGVFINSPPFLRRGSGVVCDVYLPLPNAGEGGPSGPGEGDLRSLALPPIRCSRPVFNQKEVPRVR